MKKAETGPPAFAYGCQLSFSKRYRVQSKRFESQVPFFKKIQGSKRALWMPKSRFRKDPGFKAGALNAQLPCKESESTLSQGNLKRFCQGESDSSTRAGFKIECPLLINSTMSQKSWKQSRRRSREQPGSTRKERFTWNWNDLITLPRDPK